MDLYAYMQIENLESIAKANGIEIPRLRGYRLMSTQVPLSKEDFEKLYSECELDALETLCTADPFWDPNTDTSLFSSKTDRTRKRYIKYGRDEEGHKCPIGVRWDRIHGKKRRILKLKIKQTKKRATAQFLLWNKYAGKEDVLYIHCRMGGWNWKRFQEKDAILSQPWFLDRVDDWWDGTYCDFYAKLDPSIDPAKYI